MQNFIAGSCSCRDPLDSPHSAHLHLPGATQKVLWHSHRLLNVPCDFFTHTPTLSLSITTSRHHSALYDLQERREEKKGSMCMCSFSFCSTSLPLLHTKQFTLSSAVTAGRDKNWNNRWFPTLTNMMLRNALLSVKVLDRGY